MQRCTVHIYMNICMYIYICEPILVAFLSIFVAICPSLWPSYPSSCGPLAYHVHPFNPFHPHIHSILSILSCQSCPFCPFIRFCLSCLFWPFWMNNHYHPIKFNISCPSYLACPSSIFSPSRNRSGWMSMICRKDRLDILYCPSWTVWRGWTEKDGQDRRDG